MIYLSQCTIIDDDVVVVVIIIHNVSTIDELCFALFCNGYNVCCHYAWAQLFLLCSFKPLLWDLHERFQF